MRTNYAIRDPATGLYWTGSAQWGAERIAKIYPLKGRAMAAVTYHRSNYGNAPMNRPVEIVELVLTETGTTPMPYEPKETP